MRLLPPILSIPSAIHNVPQAWQRTSPRLRLILSALGVLLVLGVAWYLASAGPAPHMRPPPPVTVAQASTQDVTVSEHALGTVVANATVNVTSRVDGEVASAQFKEGDIVHAGDALFTLDQRPFVAALEQSRADLARDQAQYTSAQRNAARYEELAKENAVSAEQRDQAVAQAGALAGTVKADKAAIDLAQLNLQYATIHSPIDGKTGPILIQPGNLVKANDTNAMVVITQVEPVKISFFLPQSDLPHIQAQQQAGKLIATIAAHDHQGAPATAPVDFIGNQVNLQTGTIELRATLANADLRFVPGELVDVSVALGEIP
ncbi:MAG TPA: efflux RND transporter periplasmic adaptor subunit, partial [Rhizomicrobium sp.]|nr:efflux RND transporter periplasmic adaptor subunit [Rhizomicrobium sp.]